MRLAILTEDDTLWTLAAWTKTIPVLKSAGYDVAGLWVCPDRLGPYRGVGIYRWYRAAFGGFDFFRLGIFSICVRLIQVLLLRPLSLEKLCNQQGILFGSALSVNDPELIAWVRQEKIDILLIMVGEIIKRPLIDAVGKDIINRHDALLPSNRGLFPTLWALNKGEPQGVTFHVVTEKIDDGKILYQEEIIDSSLTGFAINSFGQYHQRILKALEAAGGLSLPVVPSYQSLPGVIDLQNFKNRGGAMIRWRDFLNLKNLF